MAFAPIIPPHVPNLEIERIEQGPLGPSKAPPEPLFETDNDVLPDDDRPTGRIAATTIPPTNPAQGGALLTWPDSRVRRGSSH